MSIENWKAYKENLWDWNCLDGCFGQRGIRPTDIDGMVERNGYFLVIETKSPGVELKTGQYLTLRRLANTGYFTVIVVWGTAQKPVELLWMDKTKVDYKERGDLQSLRNWCAHWYKTVNADTALLGTL